MSVGRNGVCLVLKHSLSIQFQPNMIHIFKHVTTLSYSKLAVKQLKYLQESKELNIVFTNI